VVFLIFFGRFSVYVRFGRPDILLGLFVTFLSPSRLHNRLRPSHLIVRRIANAVSALWHSVTSTGGSPTGDKPREDPFYWDPLISCTSLQSDARVRIQIKWWQLVGLRAAICSLYLIPFIHSVYSSLYHSTFPSCLTPLSLRISFCSHFQVSFLILSFPHPFIRFFFTYFPFIFLLYSSLYSPFYISGHAALSWRGSCTKL
jgi:hypothetical protein